MSIAEFKKTLRANAHGPGAKWHKADFHIHIPGSSDYEYGGGDALQLLANAINSVNLSFAVILKHQEMPARDELSALQALCPKTLLVPGAEINVFVDALSKKVGKDYYFHAIVAVDPQLPRDYNHVIENAKERFTYRGTDYPAGFASSITDLGRFFRDADALFVPAHLHQTKDPSTSRSIDDVYDDQAFLGFVAGRTFTALEVRQLSTALFFDGSHITQDGLHIPQSICVASSDAHSHEHLLVRKRYTWVRAEELTFAELKAALSFQHRVCLHDPLPTHAQVLALHVKGVFVPDCWLSLNEGMIALIGSKGSGKTALLECLRFVLCTPIPEDRVASVQQHIQHILGTAGYVECLVRHADGKEYLITRRVDASGRLSVLDEDDNTRIVDLKDGPGFPVSILGWHEIEAVADAPAARVSLVDRIGDPKYVRDLSSRIVRIIDGARDQMPILQRQIKRLDGELRELWSLRKKRATLEKLASSELSGLQTSYEEFLLVEQQLVRLQELLNERQKTLSQRIIGDYKDRVPAVREAGPAALAGSSLSLVDSAVIDLALRESTSVDLLNSALGSSLTRVQDASEHATELFAAFRDSVYTPQVNSLPAEERDILTRQIQVLEETKQLPLVEARANDLLMAVRDTASELYAACDEVCRLRQQIADYRQRLIDKINTELADVRVALLRSSNNDARLRFQSRHGADANNLLAYITKFPGEESYQRLRALFASLRDLDISESSWRVEDVFWDVKAADLLDIVDDDDVQIELKVGTAGMVPIQRLSAGQRCVAVFPMLLRDTRGPLIIDQPEDNLDNRYIAHVIAPDLLSKKRQQQLLVTSHNANLVVLTDSDLILHIDSDGAQSRVAAAGFLSCGESKVKASVVEVLDGGEAALEARRRKYGLK